MISVHESGDRLGVCADLVRNFLSRAGTSLRTFRYFETRSVEVVSRHLVTLLGYDPPDGTRSGPPISYGHIDVDEQGKHWLGICVAESHARRRGFGKRMTEALLRHAEQRGVTEIRLSVDVDNDIACRLYRKFGFVVYRSESRDFANGVLFMKRSGLMAETLGSIVDKLATLNQKLFISQEDLYEIRRMKSFEDFKTKYMSSDDAARGLWERLKATCDLNVQRSALVTEVDAKVIEMIEAALAGRKLDNGEFLQRPHKTY